MPLDRSILRYSGRKLNALYDPKSAHEFPVNLTASTRFVMGRLLGQYTATANDVQTLTIGYTPTGGSLVVRAWHPFSGASGTVTIPYNASASAVQTLIQALLGSGNVTVSGGPLPTSALVFTGAGNFASMPLTLMTIETNALTGGTPATPTLVKTTNGRSIGTFNNYASANSDGTQVPKAVLSYEATTDSGGNITLGPVAIDGYNGETFPDVPAYVRGYFKTTDIIGLDQNCIDVGFCRLISGTLASGVVLIP